MCEDQPPSRNQKSFLQKLSNFFNQSNSSKADLREYLQEAKENNIIDAKEAEMMQGVLAVSELKVRDVMIPKSQMVTIDATADFNAIVDMVNESGHSRFPVMKDGQLQGILLAKDLLAYINGIDAFDIKKVTRNARVIPESKPLDILLREFRLQRLHMGIISNEYGEVSGLVTIEDVIEEIVGDIDDEYDVEEDESIKRLDAESYLVDALTEVDDFNEAFHSELDEESAETIGGHIMVHLGYVPPVGEKVNYAGLDFIVKEADERRIQTLVVKYNANPVAATL